MGHARIRRGFHSTRRTKRTTVKISAKEGASALNPLLGTSLIRIIAFLHRRPLGIAHHTFAVIFRTIPVRTPLPDIASHIVNTVSVDGKSAHRRCAIVPVLLCVFLWKSAVPDVGHWLAERFRRPVAGCGRFQSFRVGISGRRAGEPFSRGRSGTRKSRLGHCFLGIPDTTSGRLTRSGLPARPKTLVTAGGLIPLRKRAGISECFLNMFRTGCPRE